MKILVILGLHLASAWSSSIRIEGIEYSFCNPTTKAKDLFIDISPYPIPLRDHQKISLNNVTLTLLESISQGSKVQTLVEKEGLGRIPCMPMFHFHFGSCMYDMNELLQLIGKNTDWCDTELPPGQKCQMPLKAGVYGGKAKQVVTLPKLDEIVRMEGVGTFNLKATVSDSKGQEMFCISVKLVTTK